MAARPIRFSENALLATRLPLWRSRLVLGFIALGFLAIIARAIYLQVLSTDYLQKQGEVRYQRTLEIPASRGRILDRHGALLATTLPARAIWASPEEVASAPKARLDELARLLQMSRAEIDRKLRDEPRTFVYLRRQLDPALASQVMALGIPGIYQREERKRHYPTAETVAHVVGFTNIEDAGQEGFELSRQEWLSGRPGMRRVIKDRLGRVIEQIGSGREPQDGRDLMLSIDSRIQYAAFSALRDAVTEHRARAGAVVVLDVKSGEVLALANWPTFNPNVRRALSGEQLRNRVITDLFEPGSTLKPFTVALALESGKVRPNSLIETGNGRITIGSHTISDVRAWGTMTVSEVLQKSSNVGTIRMAQALPARDMWELFTSLGYGQPPQLEFPGAAAGRVRPYKGWRPIEQATLSFGHGLSVSLIQLARSYLIFAREGDLIPVSLIKSEGQPVGIPVLRPETAATVRMMLELAAGPEGTAPLAQVKGYRVAGKTGTAHKLENGRYVNKYVASFAGFAPVSDPRVVVAVMIDEPSAGKHFGGQVAAPVFARIVEDSMRALRLVPDAPFDTIIVPADPVRESL